MSAAIQKYVVGFAFDHRKDNVILIRKKRPSWQRGLLNGVGGKIEPGEGGTSAMVREFKEETGADSTHGDWQHFATLTGSDWEVYVYRCFRDRVYRDALYHEHDPKFNIVASNEAVEPTSLSYSLMHKPDIVRNLAYLIPMAIEADSNASGSQPILPIRITEGTW